VDHASGAGRPNTRRAVRILKRNSASNANLKAPRRSLDQGCIGWRPSFAEDGTNVVFAHLLAFPLGAAFGAGLVARGSSALTIFVLPLTLISTVGMRGI